MHRETPPARALDSLAGNLVRMSSVTFSVTRVGLIARNTVREATRQRLFNFMALLAFALILGAQWLREFSFGVSELRFLTDFGFGAMGFFGATLTIVATAQLFFSELDQRTVLTLFSKPVTRAEFIAGKMAGMSIVTASFCALLTVLLVAVIWSRETALMTVHPEAFANGRAIDYAAVIAAGLAQWLKLLLLSSFTLLVASFAGTPLFAISSSFFILVVCHLQLYAESAGHHGGAVVRALTKLLSLLLPDFQRFDLSESLGLGAGPVGSQLFWLACYAGGYVCVTSVLAAFVFHRREI